MHRSTTKELKNVSIYFVGDIKKMGDDENSLNYYFATFYAIDRNLSDLGGKDESKLEKSSYILEYSAETCQLCIKYVTNL